ncbi:ABC transporter ATP-binding protein [bacterium]|nr:ABC transporter ATP-binding protein [bacterium]
MNVIQAERLSKRYLIGSRTNNSASTLAETLSNDAVRLFTKLHRVFIRKKNFWNDSVESLEFWALKDISFSVQKGQILGIIGRNGSGKSTLLKILSRITPPTEGKARITGRVGSLLEIGAGFHGELTGRENVYLSGTVLGMKQREIALQFDQIVDFSGVEQFIDTPVKRYSSGMYLRLAFAVAAHLRTEILLIDEVLSVGDASFRKKCIDKMSNVAREGRTVIFVSHNLGAVSRLCDTGILLDKGKKVVSGKIDEVIGIYGRMVSASENQLTSGEMGSVEIWQLKFNPTDASLDPSISLSATFRITIKKKYWKLFVQLGISTPDGLSLVLDSRDTDDVEKLLNIGTYKMQIDLPVLWLKPGVYSSRVKVIAYPEDEQTERFYSNWVDIVIDGGEEYDGIAQRVLAPRSKWRIEKIDKQKGAD